MTGLRVLARLCWCGLPIESGETRIYRHIVTPTSSPWHHVAEPSRPISDGRHPLSAEVPPTREQESVTPIADWPRGESALRGAQ